MVHAGTFTYGCVICIDLIMKIPQNVTSGIFIMTFLLFVLLPPRKIYHYTQMMMQYKTEYEARRSANKADAERDHQ